MSIRFIARGILAVSVACVVMAGQAMAQNREKAWEISPIIGWTLYGPANLGDSQSDRTLTGNERRVETVTSDIDDSGNFGFRFAYNWTKKHEVEFGVMGSSTHGTVHFHQLVYDTTVPPGVLKTDKTLDETLSVDHLAAHANYVYNMFMQHRGKVVAYVAGGIGLINSSIFGQTAEPDLQPILDGLVGDENDLMYDYGTGIRFFGSPKVGFRMDARQLRFKSSSRGNQVQTQVGIALTIILGGA